MNNMNNRLTQPTPEVPEELEIQTSTLRLVAKCWGKPEGLPVLAYTDGWIMLQPLIIWPQSYRSFDLSHLTCRDMDFQIIAHLERHIISQIWSLMYLK